MQLLSYLMTIVQERAVFEKVETCFCECCAGEGFAAASLSFFSFFVVLKRRLDVA
jgi:hypothetical protein